MVGSIINKTKGMFSSIGAAQTLVENFPQKNNSFQEIKYSSSFEVIAILFKILGIDRDEVIELVTNVLCGDTKNGSDENGFISKAEKIVKTALEANISNILNCSTNPIISNNLLDLYVNNGIVKSGDGLTLNVSEIDFTGVLNRNPFFENDRKFYFDVDGRNIHNIWKSNDFNAYLWYIINKSDKSQKEELIWDDRYKAGSQEDAKKQIIKCTYIDEKYPNSDKIKVQICGARNESPANYYKTRKLAKNDKTDWRLNKTIFEFNHDFLSSIKLYDPKVIVAEIVESLLGTININTSLGFSVNEELIQAKIQQIIKNVIESNDLEVEDCYYRFSNEEYNNMLEKSERNRYNIINNNNDYFEISPNELLNQLSGITSETTLIEDKTIITKTINDIIATPSKDASYSKNIDINFDLQFDLITMLAYPFIRPLFTPKVNFLLLLNKKIMGSIDETITNSDDDLMNGLFVVIKDIIINLKDLLVEIFLEKILDELKPLLSLLASRLLLETLQNYKDLLMQILNGCSFNLNSLSNPYGWLSDITNNNLVGTIDNVNYADIIPTQIKPEQTIC